MVSCGVSVVVGVMWYSVMCTVLCSADLAQAVVWQCGSVVWLWELSTQGLVFALPFIEFCLHWYLLALLLIIVYV